MSIFTQRRKILEWIKEAEQKESLDDFEKLQIQRLKLILQLTDFQIQNKQNTFEFQDIEKKLHTLSLKYSDEYLVFEDDKGWNEQPFQLKHI